MTVTFIKLVYGISCKDVDFDTVNEEIDECYDCIRYLEQSGLSEDDDQNYQVYHIDKEYLSKAGKEMVRDFEGKYDLPFCVDAQFLHLLDSDLPSDFWIEVEAYEFLKSKGVPLEKFKWLYVIEQW